MGSMRSDKGDYSCFGNQLLKVFLSFVHFIFLGRGSISWSDALGCGKPLPHHKLKVLKIWRDMRLNFVQRSPSNIHDLWIAGKKSAL